MEKRNRNDQNDSSNRDVISKLSNLFDIPPSAIAGSSQMEISGNREVVVDGCEGVLIYEDNIIRLALKGMSATFTGRNLQIKVLTHNSAIISGFITNIEFIS